MATLFNSSHCNKNCKKSHLESRNGSKTNTSLSSTTTAATPRHHGRHEKNIDVLRSVCRNSNANDKGTSHRTTRTSRNAAAAAARLALEHGANFWHGTSKKKKKTNKKTTTPMVTKLVANQGLRQQGNQQKSPRKWDQLHVAVAKTPKPLLRDSLESQPNSTNLNHPRLVDPGGEERLCLDNVSQASSTIPSPCDIVAGSRCCLNESDSTGMSGSSVQDRMDLVSKATDSAACLKEDINGTSLGRTNAFLARLTEMTPTVAVPNYSHEEPQIMVVDSSLSSGHQTRNESRLFQRWTVIEDGLLQAAVELEGGPPHNWKKISELYFRDSRSKTQCKARWKKAMCPNVKRTPWSDEEDKIIGKGHKKGLSWPKIAKLVPGRTPDQVRERYINWIDPTRIKTPWTEVETKILFDAQKALGNKWSLIEKRLPGRTLHDVKNRWYNTQYADRSSKSRRQAKSKLQSK